MPRSFGGTLYSSIARAMAVCSSGALSIFMATVPRNLTDLQHRSPGGDPRAGAGLSLPAEVEKATYETIAAGTACAAPWSSRGRFTEPVADKHHLGPCGPNGVRRNKMRADGFEGRAP